MSEWCPPEWTARSRPTAISAATGCRGRRLIYVNAPPDAGRYAAGHMDRPVKIAPRPVSCGRAFPPSLPVRDGRIFGPLDKSLDAKDVNDGKPWSGFDDGVLRASVEGGSDLLETALRLCRSGTPFEVYKRAKQLGLKQWQPAERSPKSRRK